MEIRGRLLDGSRQERALRTASSNAKVQKRQRVLIRSGSSEATDRHLRFITRCEWNWRYL